MRNIFSHIYIRKRLTLRKIIVLLFGLLCIHVVLQINLINRDSEPPCLSVQEQRTLKDLTLLVVEALEYLHQTYWLDFECLAEAVANEGISYYYDHCEFGRLANDDRAPYFHQSMERYLRHKMNITSYEKPDLKFGKTVIQSGRARISIYDYVLQTDNTTINVCHETIQEAIELTSYYWHKIWRTGLSRDRFLPMKKTIFYNRMINIPRDARDVNGLAYQRLHRLTTPKCSR